MNALPFHPAAFTEMHLSGLGLDDFVCIGLIAILLVIATFVIRGGEKAPSDEPAHSESSEPAEK